jgi:hypothetical protein
VPKQTFLRNDSGGAVENHYEGAVECSIGFRPPINHLLGTDDRSDEMVDFKAKGFQDGMLELPHGGDYTGDVRDNGGARHKNYYSRISPEIQQQIDDANAMRQNLKDEIANCDDPQRKRALTEALRDIESALSEILFQPPGGGNSFDRFKEVWTNLRTNLGDALLKAQEAKAGQKMEAVSAGVEPPKTTGPVDGSSASGESGKTSGSGSSAEVFGGKSVEEMSEMMRQNPEALMEHLSEMPQEEKGFALQAITQRLQEIDRMFSMMSNMMKAAHDTAKAAINNMRV